MAPANNAIAADNLCLRKFEARDQAPINQYVARGEAQCGECAAARRHRRPIYVEAIDFVDLGDADADRDCAFADRGKEFFALLVTQLFRIVHTADERLGREDDGGSDHRTGHRADAGFVDAGDSVDAEFPQPSFVAQVGSLAHCNYANRLRRALRIVSAALSGSWISWRRIA